MVQQGQVFKLKARGVDGRPLWAGGGDGGSDDGRRRDRRRAYVALLSQPLLK
jgi:hypothetical protein